MAKQVSFGYTDTPISGVTSLNFPRGLVNYKSDFGIVVDKPGELILTNLSSPMDRPEKIRLAWTAVSDIYANTGISDNVKAPSQKGVSVLVQLTQVASITDTEDPDFRVDEPISVHMVLKIPSVEQITAEHVLTAVGRLVSGLFETGSALDSRLRKLLRGSLKPSDL